MTGRQAILELVVIAFVTAILVCFTALSIRAKHAYARRVQALARYEQIEATVFTSRLSHLKPSRSTLETWTVSFRYSYEVGSQTYAGQSGRSYFREEEANFALREHWRPGAKFRVWIDPLSPQTSSLDPDAGPEPPNIGWVLFVTLMITAVLAVRAVQIARLQPLRSTPRRGGQRAG